MKSGSIEKWNEYQIKTFADSFADKLFAGEFKLAENNKPKKFNHIG